MTVDIEVFEVNDELTQAEAEHYKDIPSEGPVPEVVKPKAKRKRAPMSEERKVVLREQLRLGREKKKQLKEAKDAPAAKVEVKVVKVADPPAPAPKVVSEAELELKQMKKEQAAALAAKEAKRLATTLKRKQNKEKKELEKKLANTVTAKPADKPEPTVPIVEPIDKQPEKKKYNLKGTKSVWAKFVN